MPRHHGLVSPRKKDPRQTGAPSLPEDLRHGGLRQPTVAIQGYSLQLHDGEGFVGDSVSRTAYSEMLDAWRTLYRRISGLDPLGRKPTAKISKKRLDELLRRNGKAAAIIAAASEDYAWQLARVVRRFLAHPSWQGVRRIVVGGGFRQSLVGELAIDRTAELLYQRGSRVHLMTLRHHPDEGGLIGWVHLAPPEVLSGYDGFLAVDIGGTNVRCGIVRPRARKAPDLTEVKVSGLRKWGHAGDSDATRREDLVQGIAAMLKKLIQQAGARKLRLAPFVGVACPGMISEDGSIAAGAQNLPGNWESPRFNLAQHLAEHLPPLAGRDIQVRLHNDAVVQGLSELPFMQGVKRWAVLTVGTGLGNASFINTGTPAVGKRR
ncbi:transcriptional regulator/sugar kinase [Polaromonas sp. CF318]|uniref:ROK family protein n=1 Tax=Polaromonas sp. CF318 TaxID=1144318 RepID=UPI000270FA1F|nr:ROK family protein [Polaromonas sp. CF318]EJL78479.1 transcriptional regulator/sugar kinase [Polaromonas sp. CF318]